MIFFLVSLINILPLNEQILEMKKEDQMLRNEWKIDPSESKMEEITELDEIHYGDLKKIVTENGWPGNDLVGEQAAHAFWLLVQHCPDIEFQKECLPLLKKAVDAGNASKADFAFLQDRILIKEGNPQIYGTQMVISNGQIALLPTENEEDVEVLRFEMDLPTLWEYANQLFAEYPTQAISEQINQQLP